MKSLLVTAAIVGLIYYFFFGGAKKPEAEKPEVIYQQQMEQARKLEGQMQETVNRQLEQIDRQVGDE